MRDGVQEGQAECHERDARVSQVHLGHGADAEPEQPSEGDGEGHGEIAQRGPQGLVLGATVGHHGVNARHHGEGRSEYGGEYDHVLDGQTTNQLRAPEVRVIRGHEQHQLCHEQGFGRVHGTWLKSHDTDLIIEDY